MNTYLIKENGVIVAAHPDPNYVLELGQVDEVLTGVTFADFAGRYQIRVDKREIIADGVDACTVTITTNLQIAALGLLIEMFDPDDQTISLGAPLTVNVTITDDQGTHSIKSSGPALIRLSPVDKGTYQAGRFILAKDA